MLDLLIFTGKDVINHAVSSLCSFKPIRAERCPSDHECSKLGGDCMRCSCPTDCKYGQTSNASCSVPDKIEVSYYYYFFTRFLLCNLSQILNKYRQNCVNYIFPAFFSAMANDISISLLFVNIVISQTNWITNVQKTSIVTLLQVSNKDYQQPKVVLKYNLFITIFWNRVRP